LLPWVRWGCQHGREALRPVFKVSTDSIHSRKSELEAHLGKDWKKDVAAYDDVHAQILKMADMLSDGIIKQHPGELG